MYFNSINLILPKYLEEAKDGDYFIGDWLRNRNTIEFLGVWESRL